jgi:hypothetical protein
MEWVVEEVVVVVEMLVVMVGENILEIRRRGAQRKGRKRPCGQIVPYGAQSSIYLNYPLSSNLSHTVASVLSRHVPFIALLRISPPHLPV